MKDKRLEFQDGGLYFQLHFDDFFYMLFNLFVFDWIWNKHLEFLLVDDHSAGRAA